MIVRGFLSRLHRDPDPLLLEIDQLGRRDGVPTIARETGRLLTTLIAAMQANRVLEIGTGYGAATVRIARALAPAGRLWTIDPDAARGETAREFLARAGLAGRVEFLGQPALDMLPSFPQRNLDAVFIEGDPTEYDAYLDLCIPLLKLSGLAIVAGPLATPRTAADPKPDDDAALRATREFARSFVRRPELEATIVPIGEGLAVGARVA